MRLRRVAAKLVAGQPIKVRRGAEGYGSARSNRRGQ